MSIVVETAEEKRRDSELEGSIGLALIYIGSGLLALNIIEWLIIGLSLRLFWVWLIIWTIGIVVSAFEPRETRRQ
jgi:hypothetical protein